MNKNTKSFFMKIPKETHTKLKTKASSKNTTMTDMFVTWVDRL